jgi:lysine/ornithine N-monooxygenase
VLNDSKEFKIPKQFTLFGHQYTIELQPDLFEKNQCYGIADEDLKKITVQSKGSVKKVTKEGKKEILQTVDITDEIILETYYHELMHIILDSIGQEKLSQNEALVNMIGKALLEIYLSSIYEEDSKK